MYDPTNRIARRHVDVERKRPIAGAVRAISEVPRAGRLPDGVQYRLANNIEMEIGEWMDVPRNPRQRNEITRIEKGRVSHLTTLDEVHRKVVMAVMPDGSRVKIDGHTRTACWKQGLATAPQTVVVEIWECADINAAQVLYDKFDNSLAMEVGPDRVTGAYQQAGISPKSPLLKDGGISTAVRELYHYITKTSESPKTKNTVVNKSTNLFAKEIELLDKVNPTKHRFPGAVVMGALLTLADDPELALKFWTDYSADAGNKVDGRIDAVQALSERVASFKRSNKAGNVDMMSAVVAAFSTYKSGDDYSVKSGITKKSRDAMRKYATDAISKKRIAKQ